MNQKLPMSAVVGFIALAGVAAEFGVVMRLCLDRALLERRQRGALKTHADMCAAITEYAVLRVGQRR